MNKAKNTILAVVGLSGTGKSVLSLHLTEKYHLHRIYFGGYIIKEVERKGLEINSVNEKHVREDLRASRGMDVVAQLALPDIKAAIARGEQVIIDGIYSFSEYELLKSNLEAELVLIAVHCPRPLRYQRLGNRAERPLSPAEIDSRDYFEIKNLEKGGPIAISDFHLINDTDREQFFAKAHQMVEKFLPIQMPSGK